MRRLPASTWPLLLLLLLAAGWWWRAAPRHRPDSVPLLTVPPDSVITLAWRAPERHVLLRRTRTGGWRLDGTVRDAVDPAAVAELLDALAGARAAVLAPLGPDSTAYGLQIGSPGLLLVTRGGRACDLRLGRRNPATGRVYGRLAGRPWLLALPGDLVSTLGSLPDRVRARTLWPGFTWEAAETLRLRRPGAAAAVLALGTDGRWWWRADTVPAAGRPAWWDRWQRWYDGRRRRDGAGEWWLCDRAAVRELLVELQETRVKALAPASGDADTAVTVMVAGALPGTGHRADFKPPHAATRADAWRDGAGVAVETIGRVVPLATRPPARFLATGVLDWPVADADSLQVVWVGIDSFRARRGESGWAVPGAPAGGPPPAPGQVVADLVLRLDRLAVAEVAPPGAPETGPREVRFRITLWRSAPGAPLRERLLLGLLDGRPTAWSPAARRRCRIGPEILTTLRAVCAAGWVAGSGG